MAVLVKICGNTSVADARMAARAGAEYLGVIVEHPPSPRSVSLESAVAIQAAVDKPVAAVTVDLTLARLLAINKVLQPAVLQLHGGEPAELVRELVSRGITVWGVASGDAAAVRSRAAELIAAGAAAILVDARLAATGGTIYGGTGHVSDWQVARELAQQGIPVVLAGGLTPANVAEAIATVGPWMVDVVSGVEASKGVKDPLRVEAFIAAVRAM